MAVNCPRTKMGEYNPLKCVREAGHEGPCNFVVAGPAYSALAAVKERGILMAGSMVRATLADLKTNTRRAVKLPPDARNVRYWAPPSGRSTPGYADPGVNYWTPDKSPEGGRDGTLSNHLDACPYGQPGDRLWVREAWRTSVFFDHEPPRNIPEEAPVQYEAIGDGSDETGVHWGRYRHARFMPRWASRILLEVVEVRVERLQDISEDDCRAEGIAEFFRGPERLGKPAYTNAMTIEAIVGLLGSVRTGYADLWDSINGDGAWAANPWVWVVVFRRIKP